MLVQFGFRVLVSSGRLVEPPTSRGVVVTGGIVVALSTTFSVLLLFETDGESFIVYRTAKTPTATRRSIITTTDMIMGLLLVSLLDVHSLEWR